MRKVLPDCYLGTGMTLSLGVFAVIVFMAVTSGPVAVASAFALAVTHSGVLAFSFARIDFVFRKHIAQLAHAHRGAFFG